MWPARAAKALVFGFALVAVAPLVVASWLEKRLSRGEWVFVLCAQSLAPVPGLPGAFLRGAFYFGALQACSWETHVGFGSIFMHRAATLGRRASLGAYCVIGHARIGAQTMIGSRVSIPSGKRQHLDEAGRLSTSEGRFEEVEVGEGTWIGEGAIVLASVGSRCIVSAGSVVTRAMPDDCIVAGNPAQVVRSGAAATLATGA